MKIMKKIYCMIIAACAIFGLSACKKLVDLCDKSGKLGNKLNDTLGDDSHTEVVSVIAALFNSISDIVCDL